MISSVFLAAVCAILVNGEGSSIPQNGVHKKESRELLANPHQHPSTKAMEPLGKKDGGVLSEGDNLSELPQVAFLPKPQDPVTPKNGGKKRKGKGRKRDPCLRKYKDYCIHGECKYIKRLKTPSCICQENYHGARCHALTLPVENRSDSYDRTTILAVTAVVLSSLCLIIIAVLLVLRCHKQGVYNVENEEKVKLGITVHH